MGFCQKRLLSHLEDWQMSVARRVDVSLGRRLTWELTFCSLAASCKSFCGPWPTSRPEMEARRRVGGVGEVQDVASDKVAADSNRLG